MVRCWLEQTLKFFDSPECFQRGTQKEAKSSQGGPQATGNHVKVWSSLLGRELEWGAPAKSSCSSQNYPSKMTSSWKVLFFICLWIHKLENGAKSVMHACHSEKRISEGAETPAHLQDVCLDHETPDFIFSDRKYYTEFSVNSPPRP